MKISYFIIACTAGIFIYLLLIGVYSSQGFIALREKQAYIVQLQGHIRELELLQGDLINDVLAMETNPQVLSREASRFGFISENQVLIRLPERSQPGRTMSPGRILGRPLYVSPPRGFFIAGAAVAGMVVWLLLYLGFHRVSGAKTGSMAETH